MSIMLLKKRFSGIWGQVVLIGMIVVLGLGMVVMFSGLDGSSAKMNNATQAADQSDVLATVNGDPITRSVFEAAYEGQTAAMAQYGALTGGIERVYANRLDTLQALEQNLAIRQEAVAKGLEVSDGEIKDAVDRFVDQQIGSIKEQLKDKPQDLERAYAYVAARNNLAQQNTLTETKFKRLMADWTRQKDHDQFETQLLNEKLMAMATPLRPVTEAEARASYDQLTMRQITVALNPEGKPARTDAAAKQRAEKLLAKLRGGADFAATARAESDDPTTRAAGGRLEGPVAMSMFPKERREILAGLKVGELVKAPIKTQAGYDLVKLEKRESQLPAEFEKNKQQEISSLAQREQQAAWAAYTRGLLAKAKLEVKDPELRAYQMMRQGDKQEEILKLLDKASRSADQISPAGLSSVLYQMAVFTSAKNDWPEAAKLYQRAADSLGGAVELPQARATLMLGVGRAQENVARELAEKGKATEATEAKAKAIEAYRIASEASTERYIHEQLQSLFTKLGRPDFAAEEAKIVEQMRQEEAAKNKQYDEQMKAMERPKSTRPMGPSPVAPK